MITAYRLYTGSDGHSHFERGRVVNHDVVNAKSIHFEETAPMSSYDWHNAPTTQYVITVSGVLEFTVHSGDSFTISPGDVLIALDTSGSGHKWRLLTEDPWRRAYITFEQDVKLNFMTDLA